MTPGDLEKCGPDAALDELDTAIDCFSEHAADDLSIIARRIIAGDLVLNKQQSERFTKMVTSLVKRGQA